MYLIEQITKFSSAFAFSAFVASSPDALVAWQDHFLRCVLVGFARYTPLLLLPCQSLDEQNVRCRDLPSTFCCSCRHHLRVRHASCLHQPCLDIMMKSWKGRWCFSPNALCWLASEVEAPSNFKREVMINFQASKASLLSMAERM